MRLSRNEGDVTEPMPCQAMNILSQECDEHVVSHAERAGEVKMMRRGPDTDIGCHHGSPDPLGDL